MQDSPVKWIKLIESGTAEDGGAIITLCLGFGGDETVRSGRLDVTLPNPIPWGVIEAIKHALELLAAGRIAYPEPIPCPQPQQPVEDSYRDETATEPTLSDEGHRTSEAVDDLIASGEPKLAEPTGGAAVMPDEEVVDDDE